MPTALDNNVYREILAIINCYQSGRLRAHDFVARVPSLVDALTDTSARQSLRLLCDRVTKSVAAGFDITDDVYKMWDTIPAEVRIPRRRGRGGLAGIIQGLLEGWS